MTLQFPTTQEITHVVRNRAYPVEQYIGRSFCPVTPLYTYEIKYDELGATVGMTKAHQVGTNPKTAPVPIMEEKRIGTAYWKETSRINEKELLEARAAGSFNQRAGRDLVMLRAMSFDIRLETRIEWLAWKATEGHIQVNEDGVKYDVKYKILDKNKVTVPIAWADPNADIIADINDALLLYRGTGGKAQTIYFNDATAALIAKNKGFRDLLKYTSVSITGIGTVIPGLSLMIPGVKFVMYDGGYMDEEEKFQPFIPDGSVRIIGGYPGEKLMDFGSTISLHNGGLDKPQPGKFSIVEDKSSHEKNPHIDITVGIYGLPRLFHPNWIIDIKQPQEVI